MDKINPAAIQSQGLLSQIPKESAKLPPGLLGSLGLDLLILLFAVASGISVQKYLAGTLEVIYPIIAIAFFLAFSVLSTLLTKDGIHRAIVVVLETLGFTLPFLGLPLNVLGIAFGVMLVLIFWGERQCRDEVENSVEIRFFRMIRHPLGKLVTAVSIAAIIFYMPQWDKNRNFISEDAFNTFYSWSAKVIGQFYPEFTINSDLGTFSKSIAETQLKKDSNYLQLPPAVRTQTLSQLTDQVLSNLGKMFGIKLEAQKNLGQTAYEFLNKSLSDLKGQFGATFVTIWAVGLFLLLRSLGAFLGYLASFLAFLIYHLMVAFGIIRIRTENKPHEVIEFA